MNLSSSTTLDQRSAANWGIRQNKGDFLALDGRGPRFGEQPTHFLCTSQFAFHEVLHFRYRQASDG